MDLAPEGAKAGLAARHGGRAQASAPSGAGISRGRLTHGSRRGLLFAAPPALQLPGGKGWPGQGVGNGGWKRQLEPIGVAGLRISRLRTLWLPFLLFLFFG